MLGMLLEGYPFRIPTFLYQLFILHVKGITTQVQLTTPPQKGTFSFEGFPRNQMCNKSL